MTDSSGSPGAFGLSADPSHESKAGVTLVELLCVIAIICILASMLMPAVLKAYGKAHGMSEELEAPGIAQLLREETRRYSRANPRYHFDSKDDFCKKCAFLTKCEAWVRDPATVFVPFTYLEPKTNVVLVVHIGRRKATTYSFQKGELTVAPE